MLLSCRGGIICWMSIECDRKKAESRNQPRLYALHIGTNHGPTFPEERRCCPAESSSGQHCRVYSMFAPRSKYPCRSGPPTVKWLELQHLRSGSDSCCLSTPV